MLAVGLAGLAGALAGAAAGELLAVRAARPARPSALGALLLLVRRVGGPLGRRLPLPSDAQARLDAAGLAPRVRPADLAAVRGAAAVTGLALLLLLPVSGAAGLLVAVTAPPAIALAPELLIGRRIRRRADAMLAALPDAIDLLRIALGGGRSVPEALAAVGAHHDGALARELRRAAAAIRIGVPIEDALSQLRRRCPADGGAELVALLLRAHRHGAEAGDGLRALAEDLRARRARAAIDQASRAAPKVQLVVALLLVPAAMLLIAAAMLALQR